MPVCNYVNSGITDILGWSRCSEHLCISGRGLEQVWTVGVVLQEWSLREECSHLFEIATSLVSVASAAPALLASGGTEVGPCLNCKWSILSGCILKEIGYTCGPENVNCFKTF